MSEAAKIIEKTVICFNTFRLPIALTAAIVMTAPSYPRSYSLYQEKSLRGPYLYEILFHSILSIQENLDLLLFNKELKSGIFSEIKIGNLFTKPL